MPYNPSNPCHVAAHPDHVGHSVSIRQEAIIAAITRFLDQYAFGYDRAAMLADLIPATTAGHAADRAKKEARLHAELDRIDTAQAGLMTELARLGTDTSPATQAYRERIQAHYAQLYTERTSTKAELDTLAAAATPDQDPTLLDELPYLAGQLTDAPAALIESLLNALDIQVLYRPEQHQATFLATLTDTTPATINALLNDPRTGTTQHTPQPGAPAPNAELAQGPMTPVPVHDLVRGRMVAETATFVNLPDSFRTRNDGWMSRCCAASRSPAVAGDCWHHGGMEEHARGAYRKLSRPEASEAVTGLGWRLVVRELQTEVWTGSLPLAADVAARAAAVAGAEGHLRLDVRADRVILSLQTAAAAWVTERDVELARSISTVVDDLRLETVSGGGSDGTDGGLGGDGDLDGDGGDGDLDGSGGLGGGGRAVQVLEIGIDALDAAAIRPFWRAVLGYVDEPGRSGPWDGLVDPLGQGPAVWFQRMDAPRPQRNRIHFDVSVPHDEAAPRIRAALAAGGTLIYDAEAPAFWVLADAEGNEACVTTWQGRDG